MEGSAGAAAGGNGEVLLALLVAFLLVGACNGMLEAGRVGGVTGDGNVYALIVHDGNAFADVVSAVAANIGALAVGISGLLDDGQLAREIVKLRLHIGEAVDSGNDLRSVLAEAVEDNAQGLLTHLVGVSDDTDSALSRRKGLVACEEGKALGFIGKQHSCEVAVSETDLAVFGNGAVDAEALETDADILGSLLSVLCACLQSDGSADAISPAYVLKADGLNALCDLIGVKACRLADLAALLNTADAVLSENAVDFFDSSVVVFK